MTRAPAGNPVAHQPYPWLVSDLFRWFGLLGLSAAGLAVAWWGASGTARVNGLITWVNVGVVAVVVGGLGNMTWLLQGRRAVAARRRRLLPNVPAATTRTPAAPVPDRDEVRLAVPGTSRHHRAGCAAVAGKAVERMSAAEHERAGRRPCGLCDSSANDVARLAPDAVRAPKR
jgi:hypothetical protein